MAVDGLRTRLASHWSGFSTAPVSAALTGVLLLATALRFFELESGHGYPGLRNDEEITQAVARMPVSEIWELTAQDVHPPLYYFVTRAWGLLFGTELVSLRGLSAVFGVLCVFLTFTVGRRLADDETAVIAAFLLAISWFHIFKSQDARMYTMWVTFTLVTLDGYLRLQANASDRRGAALFVLGGATQLYVHIFGAFFLAGLAGHWLWTTATSDRPNALGRWTAYGATIGLLFAPWMPVVRDQVSEHSGDFWMESPADPVDTFVNYYAGSAGLAALFVGLVAVALGVGIYRRQSVDGIVLLFVVGGTVALTPYVLSYVITPMYTHRYTLPALPLFYILVAMGLRALPYSRLRYGLLALISAGMLWRVGEYFTLV